MRRGEVRINNRSKFPDPKKVKRRTHTLYKLLAVLVDDTAREPDLAETVKERKGVK